MITESCLNFTFSSTTYCKVKLGRICFLHTGMYREGDEHEVKSEAIEVCSDFPAAVDYILSTR